MSNFAPKRTSYDTGDTRWLRDALKADTHGVTVTTASFDGDDIVAGLVKSGTPHVDPEKGLLRNDLVIQAAEQHLVSFVVGGTVHRPFLPRQLTAAEESALSAIAFINGTAPTA